MVAWLWCVSSAWAQDRVVWDFDTRVPGWFEGHIAPSPFPSGGNALTLDMHSEEPGDVVGTTTLFPDPPDTWVVTHRSLIFDQLPLGSGPIATFPTFIATDAAGELHTVEGSAASSGPIETDVSAVCGLSTTVQLFAFGPGFMTLPAGTVTFDNFVARGAICDGFVDADGDGQCPQGPDLDGDGVCVSDGEQLPPGGVADCDDTVVGPACLTLTVGPVVVGEEVEITVSGAAPGETVEVWWSRTLGQTCAPRLGGVCIDLGNPRRLDSAVADGSGVAVVHHVAPAGVPIGAVASLEAVVVRPGLHADRSPAVQVAAADRPPDSDGDGFDVATDCDDDDPTVFPGAPDLCGDDRTTDCGRVSDDGLVTVDGTTSFGDLGDALAAADAGAEILVCPGVYTGSFVLDVPVRLASHGAVTLDGGGAGTTLTVRSGSTVEGFTITGGATDGDGGGIFVDAEPGDLVQIDDCVVTGNVAGRGGGIASSGSDVSLYESRILTNQATTAGGGLYARDATVTFTWATIFPSSALEANTAPAGGGAFLVDSTLVGARAVANVATGPIGPFGTTDPIGGGGVAGVGDVSFVGGQVAENTAPIGGGFSIVGGTLTLVGGTAFANVADTGGGLFAHASEVTLDGGSWLVGNTATPYGGGARLDASTLHGGRIASNTCSGSGGGVLADLSTIDGTVIETNSAPEGAGITSLLGMDMVGGRIVGNNASTSGGGIGVYTPSVLVTLEGVEVADNLSDLGAGMYVREGAIDVRNSSVLRNGAWTHGGGGYVATRGTLSSFLSDWGPSGADENLPGDVFAAVERVGYTTDETFTCTTSGCVPLP